jgi:carbonic anhydrase/acetyltransferase-like protein (isoleucine patch superfamily)
LVAAGALVSPGQIVPPHSLVMGTPAKMHKVVETAEKELIRQAAQHYMDLAAEYLEPWDQEGAPRVRGFLR